MTLVPPFDWQAVGFHVFLPLAAVAGVYVVPLQQSTLLLAIGYYLFCGFCYTAGYHRLYAHRSFKAAKILQILLAAFGAANFLGPIKTWCRDHRAHHRNPDTEKDPFNRQLGFWYAYLGCRLRKTQTVGDADLSDLNKDALVNLQESLYPVLAMGLGWALPCIIASSWGDAWGGLVYAGILRTLVFLHVQFLVWALGHTFGHQPYSSNHSGKNNTLLSILSLGEGFLNFHREFPSDYRMGCFYYHVDATKWLLFVLSLFGLAYDFNKTPYNHILRVRVQQQEAELQQIRSQIQFGPEVESLPRWSKAEFDQQVAEGKPLIILDSIAHDLTGFFENHPGGPEVLQPKIGKDATVAFNGGVQRHSKAARNLASLMRVAVIENASDLRKDVQAKKAFTKKTL